MSREGISDENNMKESLRSQYSYCPFRVELEVTHQGLPTESSTVQSLHCLPLYSNGTYSTFPMEGQMWNTLLFVQKIGGTMVW